MAKEQTILMHEKNMQHETSKQRIVQICVKIFVYAFLLLMALIVLFPFYWMLISSLKSLTEYRLSVPTFWPQKIRPFFWLFCPIDKYNTYFIL